MERVRQQKDAAPCVTPSALFFYTRQRRILTSKEHAVLQGFHSQELVKHNMAKDPKYLRDVVGNAFSMPLAMAAMLAAMSACH